jgi:hypothetical protein
MAGNTCMEPHTAGGNPPAPPPFPRDGAAPWRISDNGHCAPPTSPDPFARHPLIAIARFPPRAPLRQCTVLNWARVIAGPSAAEAPRPARFKHAAAQGAPSLVTPP